MVSVKQINLRHHFHKKSLRCVLLVLLSLVFVDLVADPLQGNVELVLHPVHVLIFASCCGQLISFILNQFAICNR